MIEIKHKQTNAVLYTASVDSLRGADLHGADLRGADLHGADLRGAYLRGADLRGAYLRDADLRGAYLRGAYLRGAYLRDADLRGAVGYVCLGTDNRGYHFRAVKTTDSWQVTAGCRNYTLAEALLHWANNPDAMARLSIIAAQPK